MRGVYVVPVTLFFLLASFFALALYSNDGDELPSMLIGHEVRPFDLPKLSLNSDTEIVEDRITDADLKDGRMTVVNFWASWCGPCRIEHASLMGLQKSGVRILGVNYKDEAVDAQKFLTDLGNPFEMVAVDRDGRVGIDWGITGVPETFVVNGAGQVVARTVGPLGASDVKDILRMVKP